MNLDDFLSHVRDKKPLDSDAEIVRFEVALGERLPADYREFLFRCNGGYAGDSLWYYERDVGVHHIGGFREESCFSLSAHCDSLREFLPSDVIPIADDPFGNAICLGIRGEKKGKVYFWDHESAEDEPELVSGSFAEFVSKLEKGQE
jgi:cell wall assembly regulator SMI1